jgi:hypothetical protein
MAVIFQKNPVRFISKADDPSRYDKSKFWIYDAEFESIQGNFPKVNTKYMKDDGGPFPAEMNELEKGIIDDAEANAAATAATAAKDIDQLGTLLKSALILIDERLKALEAKAGIKVGDLKTDTAAKYDTLTAAKG